MLINCEIKRGVMKHCTHYVLVKMYLKTVFVNNFLLFHTKIKTTGIRKCGRGNNEVHSNHGKNSKILFILGYLDDDSRKKYFLQRTNYSKYLVFLSTLTFYCLSHNPFVFR